MSQEKNCRRFHGSNASLSNVGQILPFTTGLAGWKTRLWVSWEKISGRASKSSQQIDLCIQINGIKACNPGKYLQARQTQPFNID